MHEPFLRASFDLERMGLLPTGWDTDIKDVVKENSRYTELDGRSITSRETSCEILPVYVVTGEVIGKKLPWLLILYRTRLLELIREITGCRYYVDNNPETSVNINYLVGAQARYEWHVDSNPLTGILFVESHEEGDGGELVFKFDSRLCMISPKRGLFIAFDAREVPHSVYPLNRRIERISVPMNFYLSETYQDRPDGLNKYLYNIPKQISE